MSLKGDSRVGRDDYGEAFKGDYESGLSYRGARTGNDDQSCAYGDFKYNNVPNSTNIPYGYVQGQGQGNNRVWRQSEKMDWLEKKWIKGLEFLSTTRKCLRYKTRLS